MGEMCRQRYFLQVDVENPAAFSTQVSLGATPEGPFSSEYFKTYLVKMDYIQNGLCKTDALLSVT